MWIGLWSRVAEDSRYWSLRSTYRRLWHPYCAERYPRRNIVVCIEQNTTILELECSLIHTDACNDSLSSPRICEHLRHFAQVPRRFWHWRSTCALPSAMCLSTWAKVICEHLAVHAR